MTSKRLYLRISNFASPHVHICILSWLLRSFSSLYYSTVLYFSLLLSCCCAAWWAFLSRTPYIGYLELCRTLLYFAYLLVAWSASFKQRVYIYCQSVNIGSSEATRWRENRFDFGKLQHARDIYNILGPATVPASLALKSTERKICLSQQGLTVAIVLILTSTA
jgi:hypothetical protein